MKPNRVKFYAVSLFVLSVTALAIFNTNPVGTFVPTVSAQAEVAKTYKSKCAMCHSPKAEKQFDLAKTDEEHVEIILNGKKGAKPPYMPEFKSKGITAEKAKELVTFMRGLREAKK